MQMCASESASRVEASNLTECCEQKEKRADHDPSASWKEDPSSPHNHNIINDPLGTAEEYISDGCLKIGKLKLRHHDRVRELQDYFQLSRCSIG